jgi:hypothetical protein
LVLVPLPIAEFEATNKKVPVLNMHQFSQAISGEEMLLFVVRREVKQDDGIVPKELAVILDRFQDKNAF